MKLSKFDYHLPKELIAQKPVRPRHNSRLMVLDKKKKTIKHDYFYNLPKYLKTGDVLVFNDSKVFPARLPARKITGGKLEVFLLRQEKNLWQCLIGGKVRREGMEFVVGGRDIGTIDKGHRDKKKEKILSGKIVKKLGNGIWLVKFNKKENEFWHLVNQYGQAPTPPYIKKKSNLKEYQTAFAKNKGSVAAPTAGFHFSQKLLNHLKKKGIKTEFITLHVGYGTFQPVKEENIEKHKMHFEYLEVKKSVIKRLLKYKKENRRIIPVGTTSGRVLEGVVSHYKKTPKKDFFGKTNLFIYPGYKFKFINGLITNFHLPKSTLLMLVSAWAGLPFIKKAYQKAIKKKYRFYSFGDGMLID
ncbi:MAG: tRNA preQ1(34) S-adenosylmethionine ribosyltransferase-isomerase QueA [Patescibacteria group bacterium]|nr:tRNA preQ1(34) S-adenosylmethionine ribosyltransferase-isomerase QueA [Patescibacteria group bacterium]